jgi:phosphotriesterase-related protein
VLFGRPHPRPPAWALPAELDHWDDELTLANAYDARRRWYRYRRVLEPVTVEEMTLELLHFTAAGGRTIVDATPRTANWRNDWELASLSHASGVQIVTGAGYYTRETHPAAVAAMDTAAIEDMLLAHITHGRNGVRPGVIGEIGLSWPVDPQESRVLEAAAHAQVTSGLPLLVHPGRSPHAPLAAAHAVQRAGGDLARTAICHLERTLFDRQDFRALAGTGCYLELDLFGFEHSFYPQEAIDMPNDGTRIDILRDLADAGHLGQLLISHDHCVRSTLRAYGGYGYDHIPTNVVPLMRRKGFSASEIATITQSNPARLLARAA